MKTKLLLIITLAFGFCVNAQVTITGNGTGGWNQPGNLALTSSDGGINWTATNFEIVGDGQMKFSEGGTWETTGGYPGVEGAPFGFPNGTILVNGGNNIHGDLGFWNVTYNITSKIYSFTPGINPNPVIKISGGGLAADVQMNTANGIAYSKNSLWFPGGTASFNQTSPTLDSWGGSFPDGPVVTGGTISVPVGAYNVLFVKNTAAANEFVFTPIVVSMIGNFEGSAWSTDLELTTSDNIHYTMSDWAPVINPGWADTELHLKFRDNHDWATQYGCNGGNGANALALSGTAQNGVEGGGGDIFIPWPVGSIYNVDLNRSTGQWVFTSVLGTKSFASSKFKVFPNPTNNNWNFTTKNNNQITSIQIVDVLGKVVVMKNINSSEGNIDASNLNSGVYFAKITTENNLETIKLVKN